MTVREDAAPEVSGAGLATSPSDSPPSDAPPAPLPVARRERRWITARAGVLLLAALVTGAGLVVRFTQLGTQSYWNDEIFSVNQARFDVAHVLDQGNTEVHTPLYAFLLHWWIGVGGTTVTGWTHLLSAVFGLLTVVAAWSGLRRTGLSVRARALAVAVVATSAFGIVYAQETRPYALALLGATGVTAATAAAWAALLDGRRPRWHWWLLWGLVAATAHLLGAVLVGWAAVVLVAGALARRRWWQALIAVGALVLALLPQVAWLRHGQETPGFAAGTAWIPPPDGAAVRALVTSLFGSGGLDTTPGGYVWTAPTGAALVAALAAAALLARAVPALSARIRPRPVPETQAPDAGSRRDLALAGVLLVLGVLVTAFTYVVAQSVHIWTPRNLIVVVPALTWSIAWFVCALPRPGWAKDIAAVAVLLAAAAALVPVHAELGRPYKTDWRGALRFLVSMRAEYPAATFSFFGSGPRGAFVAADTSPDDPALAAIYARVDRHPKPAWAINRLHRLPGPQAVLYYVNMSGKGVDPVAGRILAQLRDPGCVRVPVHGLVLVACTDDGAASTRAPAGPR